MKVFQSLTLDITAMVLLAAVISIYLTRTVSQRHFKKVWTVSLLVLGMLAFDIVYVVLSEKSDTASQIVAFCAKELYFALNTVVAKVWCEYVGLLLWDKKEDRRIYNLFCDIAELINLVLVAVNAYVDVLFRIGPGGEFKVSIVGMLVYTALNYSMMVAATVAVIRNRAVLRKGVFKLLIIFPSIVVVAELLSFPLRGISLVCGYGISAIILIAVFRNYSGIKEIDRLIDRAIAEKLFFVCYQPIFTLTDGKCRSCEALLRLKDDEGSFVRPDSVVAAAEASGRIGDVFGCVLECVCRYLASPDFEALGIQKVHVNISTIQLSDSGFAERFLTLVRDAGLSPALFCVEVTESATSENSSVLVDNLNELSCAGVGLALDDYGSGYSNLSRILDMPFDSIKLDCSLIRSIGKDKSDAVIETSLDMIRRMRLTAVAEGVETAEQLNYLKRLGCDEIQGFFYSRPVPDTEFTDFILRLNGRA